METKKMKVKVPTKLRIRVEPSWTGRTIGTLDNKAIIEVGERIRTADGDWYKLEAVYSTLSKDVGGGYPMKLIPDAIRRIPVRKERWVCAKYVKRIWWQKKFKMYG